MSTKTGSGSSWEGDHIDYYSLRWIPVARNRWDRGTILTTTFWGAIPASPWPPPGDRSDGRPRVEKKRGRVESKHGKVKEEQGRVKKQAFCSNLNNPFSTLMCYFFTKNIGYISHKFNKFVINSKMIYNLGTRWALPRSRIPLRMPLCWRNHFVYYYPFDIV